MMNYGFTPTDTAMQDIQSSGQIIKITDLNAFIEYTKAEGDGFATEFKVIPKWYLGYISQ